MTNVTSLRKKSWENDDSLPEWAVEDPVDYGGSFDASGAFHDSENDPDSKMFHKEKEISERNKGGKEKQQSSPESGYEEAKQNFHTDTNERRAMDNIHNLNEYQGPPDHNNKKHNEILPEQEMLRKKDVDRMQEVADDMVAQLIMEDEYGIVGNENLMHGRPTNPLGLPMKPVDGALDNWFYEDPQKKIQGPFCATEMAEWYNAGYFDEKLLVKRSCDARFTSLGELIQICGGKIPFLASHLIPPIQKSSEPNPASFMSVLARSTSNPAVIANEEIDLKFQLSVLQKQYFLRQQQFILQKLSATEPWNLLTPEQQHEVLSQHLAQVSLPDHLLNINEFQNLTQSQIQDLQSQQLSFFGLPQKPPNSNFQSTINPLHVPSSMLLPPQQMGMPFSNHDQLNVLNDSNFSRHSGQLTQILPAMNMRDMIPQNLPEQQPRPMLPNDITDNNASDIDPIKSLIMQLSSQKNVGLQPPMLSNHQQRGAPKVTMGPELLRNDIVWNHMSNNAMTQHPSNINALNVINLQDLENPTATESKEKLWDLFHAEEITMRAKQIAMSNLQQNSGTHLNNHEKFEEDKDESNFNNINQTFDSNSNTKPSKSGDRSKKGIAEISSSKMNKNKKEADSKQSKPISSNKIETELNKKKEEEKRNLKEASNKKRQSDESQRKKLNEEERAKVNVPKRKETEELNRQYEDMGNKQFKDVKTFDTVKSNEAKESQQNFVQQQKLFKQNLTKNQDSTVAWSIPNVMPRGLSLAEIEKLERKNRAELLKTEQALKNEQEKPLDMMRNKESIPQWNAAVMPQTVKSLAEIQAEEHAKQSILEAYGNKVAKQREEKTRLVNTAATFWGSSNQKSVWNTGKVWGNNNEVSGTSSNTGFWDESMKNSPKQSLKGKTITKSQTVGNIPIQKATFAENPSTVNKKKPLPTPTAPSASAAQFVQKINNKNENNDSNKNDVLAMEFNSWCSRTIVSMKANVDGK